MDIGLVVDASCDVSRSLIDQQQLALLPYRLDIDHRPLLDHRDPADTLKVYRRCLSDRSVRATCEAVGVEYLRDFFLGERVLRHDRVLVLTASAATGAMYDNATQASYAILQDYRKQRTAAGRPEAFVLRVVDSGTVGAGLGALALATLRTMRTGGQSFDQVRRQTRELAARTRSRLVPADLGRLRNQADPWLRPARRVADSLGSRWLGVHPVLEMSGGVLRLAGRVRGFETAVTRVLEWAYRALVNGRIQPVLAISIGGDPRIVRDLEAYQALEVLAAARRCDLQLSVMSATLAVACGPGAFSLGVIDA
jgi:fatty acid-binding protein DegV